MYVSYENLSYWPFLSAPTQGIKVDFVRAENSSYIWPLDDIERLRAYGHTVHHLPQAGAATVMLPHLLLGLRACERAVFLGTYWHLKILFATHLKPAAVQGAVAVLPRTLATR